MSTLAEELDSPMTVPPVLRPALRKYGRTRCKEVATALRDELRIEVRAPAHEDSALMFLARLVDPLGDAVARDVTPDTRSAATVIRSIATRTTAGDLIEVAAAFGWGNAAVHTTVVGIHESLADIVIDRLAPFLARTLERWSKAGHLGRREEDHL